MEEAKKRILEQLAKEHNTENIAMLASAYEALCRAETYVRPYNSNPWGVTIPNGTGQFLGTDGNITVT